ncbi:MAG: hypothetical protein ACK4LQ_13445 [Pararhodobacter sp.]
MVIAGVPRSGSTWLFNATRLLIEASGSTLHSAWVADYRPADHAEADFHLVKLHQPAELSFACHCLLTTRRDAVSQLASLLRMGWLAPDGEVIRTRACELRGLYEFWAARSDLEIAYDQICDQPELALQRVQAQIGLGSRGTDLSRVFDGLNRLKPPDTGRYDPLTLLHPGHAADATERSKYIEIVRAAMDGR